MKSYRLEDDFLAPEIERGLIAAVAQSPALYWELLDVLPVEAFACEAEAWRAIGEAVEQERPAPQIDGWKPSSDPHGDAGKLTDLYQRRLLARTQERLAAGLHDLTRPATEIATLLEEEAASIQAALRQSLAERLTWASDYLPAVLKDAEERNAKRIETNKPVMGVASGINRLDTILGGLNDGLYLLAGGPGVGKTTLAMQLAAHAAREGTPALYVTFENSPENLILKALCARAGINPRDVMRGYAEIEKLRQAAAEWRPVADRLALIEGRGSLTIAQVRAQALRAMNRHKSERVLIIADYLQLWAKASDELSGGATRERVEILGANLRELAMRLRSPVLAIASQSREAGNYAEGKGKARLDSLKESGDLEYGADVVLFLTPATDRTAIAPARAVDLTIGKNRHGDTGRVDLIFRPDVGTLREEAKE